MMFLNNVIAMWRSRVFYVVTKKMYVATVRVRFARRPQVSGASVEVRPVKFGFLNKTYLSVVNMTERR